MKDAEKPQKGGKPRHKSKTYWLAAATVALGVAEKAYPGVIAAAGGPSTILMAVGALIAGAREYTNEQLRGRE